MPLHGIVCVMVHAASAGIAGHVWCAFSSFTVYPTSYANLACKNARSSNTFMFPIAIDLDEHLWIACPCLMCILHCHCLSGLICQSCLSVCVIIQCFRFPIGTGLHVHLWIIVYVWCAFSSFTALRDFVCQSCSVGYLIISDPKVSVVPQILVGLHNTQ